MTKAKVSSEEIKRKMKRPKARHEAAAASPVVATGHATLTSAVAPPKLQSPSPSARGASRQLPSFTYASWGRRAVVLTGPCLMQEAPSRRRLADTTALLVCLPRGSWS